MPNIKWKRSEEGYVESKDGYFRIWPLWLGCTKPVAYSVTYRANKVNAWCSTQKEAKAAAEKYYLTIPQG